MRVKVETAGCWKSGTKSESTGQSSHLQIKAFRYVPFKCRFRISLYHPPGACNSLGYTDITFQRSF